MHYLIFLLVVSIAHGAIFTEKLSKGISTTESGKINNIREYVNGDKNNHNITKETFNLQGSKDIYKDENKKVNVVGGINELQNGSYRMGAGLDFTNRRGDNVKVLALSDSTGNKLAAQGNVSILQTNKHVLRTGGFVERNVFPKSGNNGSTTYNGSLEYLNKNKLKAELSAQHDSSSGKKVLADVKYNIMSNDKHNLSATGFFGRNMPIDSAPHHNNYGGRLDYSHSQIFDANLDVKHSGDSGRTDLVLSSNLKSLGGMQIVAGVSKSGPNYTFQPLFQLSFGKKT